jgi:hypothetical protein
MTATVERKEETYEADVFATLSQVELTDPDDSWRSDTRLELLAWEISRYQPTLARQLVESGKRKLMLS